MGTFRCGACGRVFKYGNARTTKGRTSRRRRVLARHSAKCPNQIKLEDLCRLHR